MTYAGDRILYDADTHIMELPDFLRKFADPDIREELPLVSYGRSIVTDEEVEVIMSNGAQHSDEHKQSLIALGDRMITEVKEIQALGSFDKHDRVVANDMLGFIKQLVFATHSLHMPFSPSSKIPDRLRYGGARAHNRHMIDFCSVDERLMGVAAIPLENPELALEEVKFAVDGGLQAMWIPHRLAGERSPTHVDYNPIWALLQEAEIPVVFHVGGNPLQLPPAWSNTGRGVTRDWMGGGENVRARDAAVLHQGIETFVSMFVLDGVLEEFPRLKLASVELGAGWVPELLVRLDQIHKAYSKVDDRLKGFTRHPSEQIREQMAFTPFVFEDVGRLIEHSNDDLYLFSSDYPHTEGGRDPIARFESCMQNVSREAVDKFNSQNFLRVFSHARDNVSK
jgi:predicted TIM-barrel fold metal-dependent hydrolase